MVAKAWQGIDRRLVLLIVLLVAVAAVLNVARSPMQTKTVTAYFPRAVSVYEGTDVRILGVNIGEVTAVTPAGNSVRVDMKYDANTPIGLTWAGIVDVKTSYDWDPATAAAGVPESAVLGVEAPLWGETVTNIRDYEFLAFPRLAAIAEVGWSRQADRGWDGFRRRVGAQGARWTALGLNFYRAPEIPWR